MELFCNNRKFLHRIVSAFISLNIVLCCFIIIPFNTQAFESKSLEEYIYESVINIKTDINVSSYNVKNMSKLHELMDSYDYFNIEDYYLNIGISNGELYCTSISVSYSMTKSEYQNELLKFNTAVNYLLRDLKNGNLSDLNKALIVHDRLVVWAEYDEKNYSSNNVTKTDDSAYGIIVNHTGTCGGYSKAYAYLMSELGINCKIVKSSSLNHSWNLVEINSKWYNVDVTFDDPIHDVYGRVYHQYFMKSDSAFVKHEASDYTKTATSTTYDNYNWNNSLAEFIYQNGYIYWFDNVNGYVKRFSNSVASSSNVISIKNHWTKNNTYYSQYVYNNTTGEYFGYLTCDEDSIYFCSQTSIYKLNGGSSALFYTPSISNSIIGFKAYNGVFYIDTYSQLNYSNYTERQSFSITYKYANYYNIKYASNGGDAFLVEQSKKSNTNLKLVDSVPQRAGYKFLGWSESKNAIQSTYSPGSFYTQNKNITLYAVWEKNATLKLSGDVNNDGVINAKDVTFLKRYLAKGYGVTINEINADVDANGLVNAKDLTLLKRYLAKGYGVVLK